MNIFEILLKKHTSRKPVLKLTYKHTENTKKSEITHETNQYKDPYPRHTLLAAPQTLELSPCSSQLPVCLILHSCQIAHSQFSFNDCLDRSGLSFCGFRESLQSLSHCFFLIILARTLWDICAQCEDVLLWLV